MLGKYQYFPVDIFPANPKITQTDSAADVPDNFMADLKAMTREICPWSLIYSLKARFL